MHRRDKKLELTFNRSHFNFWIKYFTKRENKRFKRHLKRGDRFKEVVQKVFSDQNLPTDLFYLGLIESGYSSSIRSRANAVGPWQFIKGTGRRYGLRIDRSVDERRNLLKSTQAAARYLKDLYNIFGSWELALCAYNSGEYRVINAIRRGKSRNYLKLIKKGLLPKETIYYIPKLVAVRFLSNHRTRYRLPKRQRADSLWQNAVPRRLQRSFHLSTISRKIGLNYSVLKSLNQDIDYAWVKVRPRHPFTLYLPKSHAKKFQKIFNKRSRKLTRNAVKRGRRKRRDGKFYVVKKGDNLTLIARRFKISVKKIKQVNSWYRSIIYPGQRIYVPI